MNNQELILFSSTIHRDDEYIYIKPVCDYFGINYENQCRVIAKDQLLKKWSTKKSNELLFGDKYARILLSKKGFIRWIQQLGYQIVREDLKNKLTEYQELIIDYVYNTSLANKGEREKLTELYSKLDVLRQNKSSISSEIKSISRLIKEININGYQKPIEIPFPN